MPLEVNPHHHMQGKRNPKWNGGVRKSRGYHYILSPDHPFKDKRGYVAEHRLVIEQYLREHDSSHHALVEIDGKKYLSPKYNVHYTEKAKGKGDNRPEVLMVVKKKTYKLDNEWLHQKYYVENLSTYQIAEIAGCSRETIRNHMKQFGIKRRTYKEVNARPEWYPDLDKDFLQQKYWDGGMSLHKLAKEAGCNYQTISRYMKKRGIRRRTYSEAQSGERNGNFGKHLSLEAKERISEAQKQYWQNPEFVKKIMKIRMTKPNKLETKVNNILEKHFPGEWKYNGDFSCGVSIGGLIPDFVNVNGKKQAIEVFGDAYHDPKKAFSKVSWKRQEFGRKAIFSQYGYECIIFWASELVKDAEKTILSRLDM